LDRVLAERLLDAVRLHALEVAADPFERNLELLRKFVEREGHARVPQFHSECGIRLGAWVFNLRQKRAILPKDRITRLGELGFQWSLRDSSFEGYCMLLDAFRKREGHAAVPSDHIEDGAKLGSWVTNIRRRRDRLPAERIEMLDSVGFVWDPRKERAEGHIEALREFVRREGHAHVPASHVEGHLALGTWVGHVRSGAVELSYEHKQALDELSFSWNIRDSDFDSRLSWLETFVLREGHARVPYGHVEQGFNLGAWVVSVRSRRNTLSRSRMERLDAVGFVWDVDSLVFDQKLDALREFVQREGHAKVPVEHREGTVRLGVWVKELRRRASELSGVRIAQLDALGFVWSVKKDRT
jgi:hypothetical protein